MRQRISQVEEDNPAKAQIKYCQDVTEFLKASGLLKLEAGGEIMKPVASYEEHMALLQQRREEEKRGEKVAQENK